LRDSLSFRYQAAGAVGFSHRSKAEKRGQFRKTPPKDEIQIIFGDIQALSKKTSKMLFVGHEFEDSMDPSIFVFNQVCEGLAQFLERAALVVFGNDIAEEFNIPEDSPAGEVGEFVQLPCRRRVPAGLNPALNRPMAVYDALIGLITEKDTALCSGFFSNLDTLGREQKRFLVEG
jgi:hypothetical protein